MGRLRKEVKNVSPTPQPFKWETEGQEEYFAFIGLVEIENEFKGRTSTIPCVECYIDVDDSELPESGELPKVLLGNTVVYNKVKSLQLGQVFSVTYKGEKNVPTGDGGTKSYKDFEVQIYPMN